MPDALRNTPAAKRYQTRAPSGRCQRTPSTTAAAAAQPTPTCQYTWNQLPFSLNISTTTASAMITAYTCCETFLMRGLSAVQNRGLATRLALHGNLHRGPLCM